MHFIARGSTTSWEGEELLGRARASFSLFRIMIIIRQKGKGQSEVTRSFEVNVGLGDRGFSQLESGR